MKKSLILLSALGILFATSFDASARGKKHTKHKACCKTESCCKKGKGKCHKK